MHNDAFTIRPVRAADAEQIAQIYNDYILHSDITFEIEALSADDMLARINKLTAQPMPYYVCVAHDGAIAGYCYAHRWHEREAYRDTLEISVYMDNRYKRQGLGKRLTQHMIEGCRLMGARALLSCITEGNAVSITLHEKLGFKKVAHFEKVGYKFGRLLDVVFYELLLCE